eukprot:scaffold10955_cov125-Isochrysis_galbana.AAC.6
MRISRRRSTEKGSAMQMTHLWPRWAQSIATAIPVLPEVAAGAAACRSVCAHGKGWGNAGVARVGRALARRGESYATAGIGAVAHPRRPYPRA